MLAMKLGLNRGDFTAFTAGAFRGLYADTAFTDVTLACEGAATIRAHKAVLSSASSFFREVLAANPHPHPLLYLRVGREELAALVRFMYLGQCEVEQAGIEGFLAVARELRVGGLTSEGEAAGKHEAGKGAGDTSGSTFSEESLAEPSQTLPKDEPADEEEETVKDTLHEHDPVDFVQTQSEEEPVNDDTYLENVDTNISSYLKKCSQCVYEATSDDDLLGHIKAMHTVSAPHPMVAQSQFRCEVCGAEEYCQASLTVHMKKQHRGQGQEQGVKKQPSRSYTTESTQLLINFLTFVTVSTGQALEEVVAGEHGLEVAQELLLHHLAAFRLKEGGRADRLDNRPTIGYLTKVI